MKYYESTWVVGEERYFHMTFTLSLHHLTWGNFNL